MLIHEDCADGRHVTRNRRFMVCPMTESCGFGCALHHATYCFIAALKDNRTVVFENDAKHWPYVAAVPRFLLHL